MFLGREKYLHALKRLVSRPGMQTALIYGRRRIGKSELVKQVLRGATSRKIYYACRQVAEASSAAGLSALISEQYDLPKLGYTRIEEVLEYLFKLAVTDELILVIDEYPYLRENVKGMDSILQSLIDKYRDISQIKCIIVDSYIGVMKELITHASPLYGRMDFVLDLKQMNYREASLFYPNFSDEDKVRMYSVFGGVPYYNRLVDDSISVRENITALIASPGARLENEVPMYLGAEIAKLANANEVFSTLAQGYSRYSDILSHSHVSSGPTLADILERLIKMDIVKKISPINDSKNKKKTGYYICDNLSLFYYKYIFKYSSQMKIMDSSLFYDRYINNDFEENFVPHMFEDICVQYLIEKNIRGEITPAFFNIGKYYYDDPVNKKKGEFDIVTEDELGYVFYEVKFKKDQIPIRAVQKEIERVRMTGLKCRKYVFISQSGLAECTLENVTSIPLQALYL